MSKYSLIPTQKGPSLLKQPEKRDHALIAIDFFRERGYTDQAIADGIGVTRETINRIRTGKRVASDVVRNKLKLLAVDIQQKEERVRVREVQEERAKVVQAKLAPVVSMAPSKREVPAPDHVLICVYSNHIIKVKDWIEVRINGVKYDACRDCHEYAKAMQLRR